MLIVPELHAVFILPPRTGSDSLCLEIMRMYPSAFPLYRHAEAELVPAGYEHWRQVGFVRHPWARLWSLYKYCAVLADRVDVLPELQPEVDRVAKSVAGKSFEQWVLTNDELFVPKGSGIPLFTQAHYIPENRKSQEMYLRPDLGTVILKFQDLPKHMEAWGLDPSKRNGATPATTIPPMSKKAKKHMLKYFGWDMAFPDLKVL